MLLGVASDFEFGFDGVDPVLECLRLLEVLFGTHRLLEALDLARHFPLTDLYLSQLRASLIEMLRCSRHRSLSHRVARKQNLGAVNSGQRDAQFLT